MHNNNIKKFNREIYLKDKIEICEKMDNGVDVRQVMAEYNIARSTVYKIRKMKDQFLEYTSNYNYDPKDRKRLRLGRVMQLEEALYEWYMMEREQSDGVAPSSAMIISRAYFLKEQMGIDNDCQFSNGWLSRFKRRFNLVDGNDSATEHQSDEDSLGNQMVEPSLPNSSENAVVQDDISQSNMLNSIKMICSSGVEVLIPNNSDLNQIVDHSQSYLGNQLKNFSQNDSKKNIDSLPSSIVHNSKTYQKTSFLPCNQELQNKIQNSSPKQEQQNMKKTSKISLDTAEHYIEELIKFLEDNNEFSFQDCIQAHMLRNTIHLAKIKNKQNKNQ